MSQRDFNAIVIGGGLTGGYAAKLLTEAGLNTLLLERGPEFTHPDSYTESNKSPWDYRFKGIVEEKLKQQYSTQSELFLFTEATAHTLADDTKYPYSHSADRPFSWFRSYQLGGKSLQWGRQCYRFSDLEFTGHGNKTTQWPIRYDDLATYYEQAEKYIGVR